VIRFLCSKHYLISIFETLDSQNHRLKTWWWCSIHPYLFQPRFIATPTTQRSSKSARQPCTESQTSRTLPQQNTRQPWLWSNTTPTRQLTSHEPQLPLPAIRTQAPTHTDLPQQLPADPPAAATIRPAAPAVPAARTRTLRHELSAQLRAQDMRPDKRRTTTSTTKACGKSGTARLWTVLGDG
jgi:hypothetical protein